MLRKESLFTSMSFKFERTEIEGVYIIEPQKFGDHRGYFMEIYNESEFNKAGLNYKFVQDNQSKSKAGVLRGLHFQKNHPQAKLVRVLEGEVFDVAVDLRKNSKTYGKWVGVVLSAENNKQFMIPRGFAHGFLVLSETATFAYKCDDFYHPEDEGGIMRNDETVNIVWPEVKEILLSKKDTKHPSLKDSKVEF